MAKTQWPVVAPFGILTPALQELYWGTNANTGHNHSGLNSDGSCPKINLNTDIVDDEGTVDCKVTTADVDTQIDITLDWVKLKKIVTINFPDISGTQASNSGTFRLTPDTSWPTEMISVSTAKPWFSLLGLNDGNLVPVVIQGLSSTSQIWSILRLDNSAYTGTGSKGLESSSITYRVVA